MPILRNQAKAGPLHAGVPGEVLSAYRDGPWFRCHASCTSAGKSIPRIDFGRQRMLPDHGPLPKHFCCGKWREMTSAILTK